MYNDSNINVNSNRTVELFREIVLSGIKIPSHIFGMQVKDGFEDYIYLMKASGVNTVRVGIESGSIRERKSMNKPNFDNDLSIEMVAELSKNQIMTWVQFIFCYPDQTVDGRKNTIDLILKMNKIGNPKYIKHFWYQFVVHHGTEDIFKRKYNVQKITPKTWSNEIYDVLKIYKLYTEYKNIVPANCIIKVDEI